MCAHTCVCALGCIEERNEGLRAMGWLRPKFVWALPAWRWCPHLQETWGGVLDCCSLLSAHQSKASVLPSYGGKQPVPVGLLWIQQAAFVSPSSETLQKATEWAGDCCLGRQPWVFSTMVERGNCIYARGPLPVCASFGRHTHSQMTVSIHTNTHMHRHVRKSNRTAEFVKCTLLHVSIFKFLMKGIRRNYWWLDSFRLP